MLAISIGEFLGTFVVLALVALTIVWLGRRSTDQRTFHGIAALGTFAFAMLVSMGAPSPSLLGIFASGLVALLLQWSYRRALKMPPSGLARLYAILVGFIVAVGGTFAIVIHAETIARNSQQQTDHAAAHRIADPYDKFRQAATSEPESTRNHVPYGGYPPDPWEDDPWIVGGVVGGILWFICIARYLALWVWRGFASASAKGALPQTDARIASNGQ